MAKKKNYAYHEKQRAKLYKKLEYRYIRPSKQRKDADTPTDENTRFKGCNTIHIQDPECSVGLYFALSIRLAMCVRAVQEQLDANVHHSVDEEYTHLQEFLNDHPRDKYYDYDHEYHDGIMHKYQLPFVFLPLTQFKDMETILGPFDINYPKYDGVKGIWVKMVRVVVIKGMRNKVHKYTLVPLMHIGTNKTNVYYVDLDGDQSYVRSHWANKLLRIKACIAQRDRVASICLPNSEEIEYAQTEMNNILTSKNITLTHLELVARTFLSGLGPFIQDQDTLCRDADFLIELSSIQKCSLAKSIISQYTKNLKNKLESKTLTRRDLKALNDDDYDYDDDDQYLVDDNMDIDLSFLSDHECQTRYGSSW